MSHCEIHLIALLLRGQQEVQIFSPSVFYVLPLVMEKLRWILRGMSLRFGQGVCPQFGPTPCHVCTLSASAIF